MVWLNKPDNMRQAWRHRSQKPSFRCKNLADISYTDQVIAILSQILLPWQRGLMGENAIGSIQWPIPKNPPIGAKISQFVPNFIAMTMEVDWGKMQLAAFDGPSPKAPHRRKNLADISYASQVIAHFVPNFVAIATGSVGEKCNYQHSMAHPRKSPYRRKNLLRKPSYSQLCPKFRCHGNQGGSGVKLNDTIRLAILENRSLEPKITTLSYTQPKLWQF